MSFTIAPANASITCGSTTPVTFTINNGAGTTGITDYSWNLGATPNGWLLPNGAPAPASYSTGLAGSLTLTPDCGKPVKNISASVTANGINYNTNTSILSVAQPSVSISGSSTLCGASNSYFIEGLPCNGGVTWASSNSNIASVTTNGNTATLTKLTNGTTVLTANVTPGCDGIPIPLSKTVSVGGAQSQSGTIYINGANGPKTTQWGTWNVLDYGLSSSAIIVTMTNPSSTWTYGNGPVTTWWMGGSPSNALYLIPNSYPFLTNTITMSVSSTNECGQHLSNITYFQNYTAANKYVVYPNPTNGEVFISSNAQNTSGEKMKQGAEVRIQKIELLNNSGTTLRTVDFLGKPYKLDISGYPSGQYFLRIFDGTGWETKKIVLQ